MGGQAYSDTLGAILYLKNEKRPMGLLKTVSFTRSLAILSLGSNETSLVEDWLNMYLGNGANFVCAIPSLSSSRYYYDWVYILWTMANLLPRSKYFPFFSETPLALWLFSESNVKKQAISNFDSQASWDTW